MQQAPNSQTPLKSQPKCVPEKRENLKGTEYRVGMRKSVARTFGDILYESTYKDLFNVTKSNKTTLTTTG